MKTIAKKTYTSPTVIAYDMKVQAILMGSTLDPSNPNVSVSPGEHTGEFSAPYYDFGD